MSEPDRELRRRVETRLRASLSAARIDGPAMDEVSAYVDGSMEPSDRAAFEELLALDPALRDEVSDLRELDHALRHEVRPSPRWTLWAGLAAAAAVSAVLVWPPFSSRNGAAKPMSAAPPMLTLRDAGRDIALRADGSVDGLPRLPDEARGAVVAALRDGALTEPAALRSLRAPTGALLGPGSVSTFRIVGPLATFVRSDRPRFRWSAKPGALSYELVVFTEDLVKVADLRVSDATEAALPSPLERGRTYLWQVAAIGREGCEVAPAPPEPEARFRVLSASESETLEKSLAAAGDSDLVASVLLARAGIRDEAETRLARLAAANPNAIAVGRMLEAIRR